MSALVPSPRAHDLLWILPSTTLHVDRPLPTWAEKVSLARVPLVVRRASAMPDRLLPVGLRGRQRHERLATRVPESAVMRVVTPESLAHRVSRHACLLPPLRAIAALRTVAPMLDELGLPWGPTGSVGFTLASGLSVLHQASDLDLLIRMPVRPARAQIASLRVLYAAAPCRLDVQIDTGQGAFALMEWLAQPRRLLLKTNTGPALVADPWARPEREVPQ